MVLRMVIFDLDGVLVDACEWHKDALNLALMEACGHSISEEDHISIFNGIPTRVKLTKLSEMGILDRSLHEKVFDLKQKSTIALINERAKIRHEKIDMIKQLKKEGITVCCYTNSIKKTAHLMLQKTGVLDLLEEVVTNEDVEESKPHPEGYKYLVEKYGFNPDEVIIVEDSPKGLAAARGSGCRVIKVDGPENTTLELFTDYLGESR
tara:strand:- start:300 stop:923 length:624 start_codon:yes stop_codon:yes gene_type:complete